MAANQAKVSEKLKESIDQAQARLTAIEDEAQKVLGDLVAKGRASRAELTKLLNKLAKEDLRDELLERVPVKQLSKKANGVREDLTNRFEELFERAIAFAGVASREEVQDLAKELDRINRKLDKALGAAKKPKAKA